MPKQRSDKLGRTHTDPNFKGDLYEKIVMVEALKKGAFVFMNCGCTGKTDLIIEYNDVRIPIDVKASTSKKAAADGVYLVTVDVDSHKVKWGTKRNQPVGLEDFWS